MILQDERFRATVGRRNRQLSNTRFVISLCIEAVFFLAVASVLYNAGGFAKHFAIIALLIIAAYIALWCKDALFNFITWRAVGYRSAVATHLDMLRLQRVPYVESIPTDDGATQYMLALSECATASEEERKTAAMLFGYYSGLVSSVPNITDQVRRNDALNEAFGIYMEEQRRKP